MEHASDARIFVHPKGLCESDDVGSGTRIWAFAHVLAGAEVGRDCNVCDGAYIEGGASVGDRVTVKNQVMIFEGVAVADDVFLGPGVTFTNDLRPRAHIKRGGDALLPTTVRRRRDARRGRHRGLRNHDRGARVRRRRGGGGPGCAGARVRRRQSRPPDRLGVQLRGTAGRRLVCGCGRSCNRSGRDCANERPENRCT